MIEHEAGVMPFDLHLEKYRVWLKRPPRKTETLTSLIPLPLKRDHLL